VLKLKYLFDNRDLAEMLLKNWDYEDMGMFKHYRVSSNAIYPFKREGTTHFLRFAPQEEKLTPNLQAELDFIAYLRGRDYGVLVAVPSKAGEKLVDVQTPWGAYVASVFKRVAGVQLDRTDFSDDVMVCYGKALGTLHRLSSQYVPGEVKRWSYADVLDWIQDVLTAFSGETAALAETALLREYFASVPKSQADYGLIHYDFEYDNVFYDEQTRTCHVIDFDDAMYHWYGMDIEQALESLREEISPEDFEQKKQCFMDGYRAEYELSVNMEAMRSACRRFASLYGYARVLRAAAEKWDNEPEWMTGLRERLAEGLGEDSVSFGKPL
jgi:Ser/Thr protein kinase RdoA (MazF antagonist)